MNFQDSGARQPSHRSQRKQRQPPPQQYGYPMGMPPQPQLFEDTSAPSFSSSYPPPSAYGMDAVNPEFYGNFPGAQFLGNPMMANMAMAYGENLMGQGKQMVDQNLEKYVPISKIKYYFAVDTSYVWKKLIILLFPFTHSDWTVKYNQDEPVAPRYEVNAPDLYIPVMAFVTYILLAGVVLGTQSRFTPELLGIQASTALGWLVLEVIVLLLTMYIMNVQTDLGYLDLISFCGYKYVGMILSLAVGMIFASLGYYSTLLYSSLTLAYFLVKTLRVQVLPKASGDTHTTGNKRRMYLLLVIAFVQPFFMYWLTRHFIPAKPTLVINPS